MSKTTRNYIRYRSYVSTLVYVRSDGRKWFYLQREQVPDALKPCLLKTVQHPKKSKIISVLCRRRDGTCRQATEQSHCSHNLSRCYTNPARAVPCKPDVYVERSWNKFAFAACAKSWNIKCVSVAAQLAKNFFSSIVNIFSAGRARSFRILPYSCCADNNIYASTKRLTGVPQKDSVHEEGHRLRYLPSMLRWWQNIIPYIGKQPPYKPQYTVRWPA